MNRSAGAFSRRLRGGTALAGALLATLALIGPTTLAGQPDGPPGNNGTVKIHDGAAEPASEVRNEPHVCTFHLHFFFADPEQSGSWEIQEWAPGDKGTVVLTGTYDTLGDGEDRQPETGVYELPEGHYKLFWDGDVDKHDKMKVFWVDCGGEELPATPTPTPPATPTPPPTPTPPATPTPPPTPTPTPTPTLPTQPTPTPVLPTPTPSGEELPVEGTPPPSPAGGVAGATGAPAPTPPATDAEGSSPSTSSGWHLALFSIAALTIALAFGTPKRRSSAAINEPKRHR